MNVPERSYSTRSDLSLRDMQNIMYNKAQLLAFENDVTMAMTMGAMQNTSHLASAASHFSQISPLGSDAYLQLMDVYVEFVKKQISQKKF